MFLKLFQNYKFLLSQSFAGESVGGGEQSEPKSEGEIITDIVKKLENELDGDDLEALQELQAKLSEATDYIQKATQDAIKQEVQDTLKLGFQIRNPQDLKSFKVAMKIAAPDFPVGLLDLGQIQEFTRSQRFTLGLHDDNLRVYIPMENDEHNAGEQVIAKIDSSGTLKKYLRPFVNAKWDDNDFDSAGLIAELDGMEEKEKNKQREKITATLNRGINVSSRSDFDNFANAIQVIDSKFVDISDRYEDIKTKLLNEKGEKEFTVSYQFGEVRVFEPRERTTLNLNEHTYTIDSQGMMRRENSGDMDRPANNTLGGDLEVPEVDETAQEQVSSDNENSEVIVEATPMNPPIEAEEMPATSPEKQEKITERQANNIRYYFKANLTAENKQIVGEELGINPDIDLSDVENVVKIYEATLNYQQANLGNGFTQEEVDGYPGKQVFEHIMTQQEPEQTQEVQSGTSTEQVSFSKSQEYFLGLEQEKQRVVEDVLGLTEYEKASHDFDFDAKVQAFQERYEDLENDGILGPRTLEKMETAFLNIQSDKKIKAQAEQEKSQKKTSDAAQVITPAEPDGTNDNENNGQYKGVDYTPPSSDMPRPDEATVSEVFKEVSSQEYFDALTDEDKNTVASYVGEVDGSPESTQRIFNFQEKIKYSVDPVEIGGMSLDLEGYVDRESIQAFGNLDEGILQIMTAIEFAKQEYVAASMEGIEKMIQSQTIQNLLASYEGNFTLKRDGEVIILGGKKAEDILQMEIDPSKPQQKPILESEVSILEWVQRVLEENEIEKKVEQEEAGDDNGEKTGNTQGETSTETETTVREDMLKITEEVPVISDKLFNYYKEHLSTYLHKDNRAMVEDVLDFSGMPDLENREHMSFIAMKVKTFQEKYDDLENDGYIGRKTLGKIIDVYIEGNYKELNFDETDYRSTVEMEMKSEWGKENADAQLGEGYVEWEFTDINQLINIATQSYEGPIVNPDGDIVVFRLGEDSYNFTTQELPANHGIKKEYTAFHKSGATSDAINPDEGLINEGFKNHRYALGVLRNGNMVQFHDLEKGSGALSPLATQHHGSSLNPATIAIEMTSRNIQDGKYVKGIDGLGYVETEEINQNQMVSGRILAESLGLKIIDSLDPLINEEGDFVSRYIHNGKEKYSHADHFNDDIMRYFGAQIRDKRREYFYEEVGNASQFPNGTLFPANDKSAKT